MDCSGWKCWILLHVLISLPAIGLMCCCRSATTESTPISDTQPAHMCYITTYTEDELLSNNTLWTCVTNGVISLHWSRDCKFPIDSMDIVVNLTRGVTTKMNCSLVSTKPPEPYTYEWRMDAPIQSKIILRVHHSDEENDMTVIDSNSTHIFPANESFDNGNDFVSSSNTVIMAATFSDSAQSQDFIVRGWTLEDAGTCEGRCGPYVDSKSCQCNTACIRFTDCCNDYRALCGEHNSLVPIVVVLSIILLIIGATLGVIRYKRRQSSLKAHGKQQRQSLDGRVIDSSVLTGTGDRNKLEDSTNPVQRPPGNATPIAPFRAVEVQQNARTGFRVPGSSTGENMAIYNEVGEENYNVLFGGKEQGDYHTYSLPDSAQGMTSKEREGKSGNPGPVKQPEHDESRNGSTIANHSSDVPQREIKPTKQAHASDHGSTNAATQSKQEPDYETPESKPKTTSDYEDPVKDRGAVHEPYDHLRHKTASEVPKQTTAVVVDNRTSLGAEENAINTYQTLGNRQEEKESGEYSKLQRPLDIKPSPDHPRILSSSNEYGELGGNI